MPPHHNSNNRSRVPRQEKERAHRINEDIEAMEIRLVGMEEESQNGVYPTAQALSLAESLSMDLVEIVPTAVPPVCRIVEYQRFLYQLKKKEKELKAHSQQVELKEVRFGPTTDDHDFDFKLKHAQEFLREGHKVKAYVHFKGRMIVYTNRGTDLLSRFVGQLEDLAKVESEPRMEGKRMVMILAPKKAK